MSETQITADDITHWETIDDIATSLKKRGLKPRPSLDRENGFEDELLIETEEDKYIALIEASPGDEPSDYNRFQSSAVPTTFVSTRDFQTFSIIRRKRIIGGDKHGRLDRQKFSFNKEQITSGDRYSALDKLNDIEYGDDSSLNSLFDTRQVVDEFYEEFESIRTDLVTKVSGIDDDRGDAKQRYVQVTLNRLIFLHFIQEKGLLGAGEGDYLLAKHDEFAADGDVQTNFYEPLFFKALAEEGFQSRKFDRVPYLNGGLFSETAVEQEFEDARLGADAAESDDLYREILEFLDSWNWNVDERLDVVEPKNLSPSVLGHIFEQSVNQKEKGAYYTPEEITSFMARESIHPRILDAVNEATGADYDEIDAIFGLDETPAQGESGSAVAADGGAITQQAAVDAASADHVETLYFDVLTDLHILDPAVGSGAFLLAAEDVLLDIYLHAIEYFEQLYEEQPFGVSDRVKDELDTVNEAGSKTLYAKREIILNNLYGVDIDDGAVEICKLRLWLSMVADIEDDPSAVDPLPNIDFNIRQGNSLIGFTELVEVGEDGNTKLTNYGGGVGEGVREKYEDVIEATENHRAARTKEETERWREEAERRRETHAEALDTKTLDQFHEADIEEMDAERLERYSPFHWVIEFPTVYRDGAFDVIIGNPPWDVLTASRDEFFSKYDETFRSRTPEQKEEVIEEFLEDNEIEGEWEDYQREMEMRTSYFTDTDQYTMQTPVVAGQTNTNENDLSALFLERVFSLLRPEGYAVQVLPGNIFNGSATKDLRDHLLNKTTIENIVEFENHGIFDQLHNQYRFGIVTFKNSGETERLRAIFQQRDLEILNNLGSHIAEMPRRVLADFSPEASIFPAVASQAEADVLKKILQWPSVSEEADDTWRAIAHRELILAYDDDRLIESDTPTGDYPVLGGANFYQFSHDTTFHSDLEEPTFWSVAEDKNPKQSAKKRVREKAFNGGDLKKKIYCTFGGEKSNNSQIGFVNELLEEHREEPLNESDIRLDCTEYRIVFRDVTNSTNERTMIATVLPPGPVCVDSVRTIEPFEITLEEEHLSNENLKSAYQRIFTDRELFVLVGLLNSIPFDFLMRNKVSSHIPKYKFEEAQVPRLRAGDDWFNYISTRAARLNCYGEEFAEMRERLEGIEPATDQQERRRLQAEIDAAAFHAYGLEVRDVEFVLDDFHRVEGPRMMENDYFDTVLEKYRELSDNQPTGD